MPRSNASENCILWAWFAVILVAAVVMFAGCQSQRAACIHNEPGLAADGCCGGSPGEVCRAGSDRRTVADDKLALSTRTSGRSQYLFGPTALPMGLEDRGYFAYAPSTQEQLSLFSGHYGFVNTRIYSSEDGQRPEHSRRQVHTWSQEVQPYR